MPYLVVATVLIGLVAGANLIFTYGVIRRLREHTARLDATGAGRPEFDLILAAGAEPGPLAPVRTTTGEALGPDDLAGGALVGFFSPDCAPCREQAPRFAERAAAGGRERVLAVAVGTPEATGELVALLEPVARVVIEVEEGPLHRAFAVQGYPAMCVLDADGRVKAAGSAVDRLPELPAV
ncbi:TlpA family protein disulfide reductase [Plantactinospora sp. CA-294935]|uniref:TlpA family protein disulfide reductase n=1 Tax=Plantactinospora sp. CA-294935 TaxID=3240012 RepID=UPI003D9344F4